MVCEPYTITHRSFGRFHCSATHSSHIISFYGFIITIDLSSRWPTKSNSADEEEKKIIIIYIVKFQLVQGSWYSPTIRIYSHIHTAHVYFFYSTHVSSATATKKNMTRLPPIVSNHNNVCSFFFVTLHLFMFVPFTHKIWRRIKLTPSYVNMYLEYFPQPLSCSYLCITNGMEWFSGIRQHDCHVLCIFVRFHYFISCHL